MNSSGTAWKLCQVCFLNKDEREKKSAWKGAQTKETGDRDDRRTVSKVRSRDVPPTPDDSCSLEHVFVGDADEPGRPDVVGDERVFAPGHVRVAGQFDRFQASLVDAFWVGGRWGAVGGVCEGDADGFFCFRVVVVAACGEVILSLRVVWMGTGS